MLTFSADHAYFVFERFCSGVNEIHMSTHFANANIVAATATIVAGRGVGMCALAEGHGD
jgi:hypothetical protein